MKWQAKWWGILLVAETEDDKQMLRQLCERLPEEAEIAYEDGDRELYEGDRGGLILEFRR